MIFPNSLNAPELLWPVLILVVITTAVVIWSYARSSLPLGWKVALASLKILGVAMLGLYLLEPQSEFEQADPGSNILVVLTDKSQSLTIKDKNRSETRMDQIKSVLNSGSWMEDLGETFELRNYTYDSKLESVADFSNTTADGVGSNLISSLKQISDRYESRPVAGVIVLSDFNTTDWDSEFDVSTLPPIYAVAAGNDVPAKDVGITEIAVSQTNFESAPVTITASAMTHGYEGKTVFARLLSNSGEEIERKEIGNVRDEKLFAVRFQLKPETRGLNLYRVELSSEEDDSDETESTLLNNSREILIDRGRGPFRVLYVTGRPNWEYKFLRRALAEDHEVDLVGLIRMAKKEPKFSFRSHQDESTNPLYRGFGNEEDQTAEQYDEPVLVRLDAKEGELSDGFPKDEETLFAYDAIVIDDLEADFFTPDQKSLLQQFVSRRGGGLLMLGGQESFEQGNYDHTPIGEMLPIYLTGDGPSDLEHKFQLNLTREGWIQPWVRVNATENAERRRIANMPSFQTLNTSRSIKPGATVLATVSTPWDEALPALVVQKFGAGKTAAIMLGDLWRWQMQGEVDNDDLQKSWRQTMRWLVSETPRRTEVTVKPQDDGGQVVDIFLTVRDEQFRPLDNVNVDLRVKTPDGTEIQLTPDDTSEEPGTYQTSFFAQDSGPYRVLAKFTDPDGTPIETRETGWIAQPNAAEFERLTPNFETMKQLTHSTNGEIIKLNRLSRIGNTLKNKKVPNMIKRVEPWWHQWWTFVIAIGLLVSEWGFRRWKGMA